MQHEAPYKKVNLNSDTSEDALIAAKRKTEREIVYAHEVVYFLPSLFSILQAPKVYRKFKLDNNY